MIVFKELETYSINELTFKLKVNEEKLDEIINILLKKGIIKYNNNNYIQFSFVGIIIVKEKVVFVLPKYVKCKSVEEEKNVLRIIVKLLNAFIEQENLDNSDIEHMSFDKEFLEENFISIVCFLLDDFIENAKYENEIDTVELNGDGDINWDKTIEYIDPIVINDQWIYGDLITNKSVVDSERYITKLYGTIINECNNFLSETGLNEILLYSIEEIRNTLEDLEDDERINRELDNEITVQFNDRKRRVLYAMKSYLEKKSGSSDSNLLLYGTRNFKWVWEVICGRIFDNEFIKQGSKSKYEIYGIESPKWHIDNKGIFEAYNINEYSMKKNRLTPDILKVVKIEGDRILLILDAKYYNVRVEGEKLEGNPGIEDITKQYLYHSALKKYIENNRIDRVINSFLFPSYDETYIQGNVELDFMKHFSDIDINLIQLNVEQAIELYCSNKMIDFENIISKIEESNKNIYSKK